MKCIDFYADRRKSDTFSKVELRKSRFGGMDIFVDGLEIPNVLSFTVKPKHPFPRIVVEIAIEELLYDQEISPKGLDDGYDDRCCCEDSKNDICPSLPRNGLPAKIKTLFCKRDSARR